MRSVNTFMLVTLHITFEKAGCGQITGFMCVQGSVHRLLPVQPVSASHTDGGSFSFAVLQWRISIFYTQKSLTHPSRIALSKNASSCVETLCYCLR